MDRVLVSMLDDWRRPRGVHLVVAVTVILLLLALACALTVATGGPPNPRVHVLYLPVIVAAFCFGRVGGILVGLVAGLTAGPIASLAASTAIEPDWYYRAAAFALVGWTIGVAMSLLNARIELDRAREEVLAQNYAKTLRAFASMVALRDEPTGGHCERVAYNACQVGQQLGLDGHELEALHWAGMLHDLGKIGVPERILLKPGRLTSAEFRVVQTHATLGARLIGSVSPTFDVIAEGVRTHHERWDGSGYPVGLKGHDIPLFGRILAVVDTFEALTSERPYREPLPPEDVVAYLRQHAGTHFDPVIVGAFESAFAGDQIRVAGEAAPVAEQESLAMLEDLLVRSHAVFRPEPGPVGGPNGSQDAAGASRDSRETAPLHDG